MDGYIRVLELSKEGITLQSARTVIQRLIKDVKMFALTTSETLVAFSLPMNCVHCLSNCNAVEDHSECSPNNIFTDEKLRPTASQLYHQSK